MTERQLNRLLLVASEAAHRFVPEEPTIAAISWLYRPLPLFGGDQGIHACVRGDMFLRAMLMHANDAPFCRLPKGSGDLTSREREPCVGTEAEMAVHSCGTRASLADLGLGELALYTLSLVEEREDGYSHIFAAFLAVDEQDARKRVLTRLGSRVTTALALYRGFDPSEPIAASLLSDALSNSLSEIAIEPRSNFAAGLDLFVEYRFAS